MYVYGGGRQEGTTIEGNVHDIPSLCSSSPHFTVKKLRGRCVPPSVPPPPLPPSSLNLPPLPPPHLAMRQHQGQFA